MSDLYLPLDEGQAEADRLWCWKVWNTVHLHYDRSRLKSHFAEKRSTGLYWRENED